MSLLINKKVYFFGHLIYILRHMWYLFGILTFRCGGMA